MTEDDWKSYYAQLKKHEGYEPIVLPPDALRMGILKTIGEDELRSIGLRSACRKALKRYNNKEKTQWQYVDLIKANTIRYFKYYVTFEAKKGDDRKQFQTLLTRNPICNPRGRYVIKEVRPKPLPMADEAICKVKMEANEGTIKGEDVAYIYIYIYISIAY